MANKHVEALVRHIYSGNLAAAGDAFQRAMSEKAITALDTRRSEIAQSIIPSGRKLNEEAPPGMESWVKDNKERFKKEYGDDWEDKLYATAWSIHNKKA